VTGGRRDRPIATSGIISIWKWGLMGEGSLGDEGTGLLKSLEEFGLCE